MTGTRSSCCSTTVPAPATFGRDERIVVGALMVMFPEEEAVALAARHQEHPFDSDSVAAPSQRRVPRQPPCGAPGRGGARDDRRAFARLLANGRAPSPEETVASLVQDTVSGTADNTLEGVDPARTAPQVWAESLAAPPCVSRCTPAAGHLPRRRPRTRGRGISCDDLRHHCATLVLRSQPSTNVHDTYGHATGNLVLREAARRPRSHSREGVVVARLEGDDFVMPCRGVDDQSRADELGVRVRACRAVLVSGAADPGGRERGPGGSHAGHGACRTAARPCGRHDVSREARTAAESSARQASSAPLVGRHRYVSR